MADAAVVTRTPLYGERRYVWSTARSIETARYGGRFCHFESIVQLVDQILDHTVHAVACIPGVEDDRGRPEIQGFIVEDPTDGSIEFLHLRKTYQDMASPALGARVLRALLKDRTTVTLRRAPSREALNALLAAGCTPIVRPRSV